MHPSIHPTLCNYHNYIRSMTVHLIMKQKRLYYEAGNLSLPLRCHTLKPDTFNITNTNRTESISSSCLLKDDGSTSSTIICNLQITLFSHYDKFSTMFQLVKKQVDTAHLLWFIYKSRYLYSEGVTRYYVHDQNI